MKKLCYIGMILIVLTACGKKTLTCSQGTLSGNRCIEVIQSEAELICEDGEFNEDQTACIRQVSLNPIIQRTCPNGYHEAENACYQDTPTAKVNAYRCPKNQQEYNQYISPTPDINFYSATLKGNQCEYMFCERYIDGRCLDAEAWLGKAITYQTCPENSTLIGDQCFLKVMGEATYTCQGGYELVDNKCVKTVSESPTYSCKQGAYNATTKKCEITIESMPQEK